MAKKRVYVESSVISYLTARPASDILRLAKQIQTRLWWEHRHRWELFISPTVMWEIQRGDRDAARKRVEAAVELPLLDNTEDMGVLAKSLIMAGLLPEKAYLDAFHIASATLHGMDYLVTWNQTHLFNLDRIESLYATIREIGHAPPVLVRPDYLQEAYHGS